MENFDKENRYLQAKEKVKEIKKFYGSLISYVIVIGALAALNYWVDQLRHPWFLWAALGWGIGIVFQAAKAFKWNSFLGKDWEERKMKQFMEEDEKNSKDLWK